MAIVFTCTCGKKLEAREENAGRKVRCPQCERILEVPSATQPDRPAREELETEPAPERRFAAEDELDDDAESSQQEAAATSGKALGSLLLGAVSFCVPLIPAVIGVILGVLGLGDISRSRGRLSGKWMAITGIILAIGTTLAWIVGTLMMALLLPAVEKVREAASRTQSANNLKQIGIGLHAYLDEKGTFPPPAIYGRDGKALLSWRVTILPYLQQQGLYGQFHLDEPWDSPNNHALLARMPPVYAAPGSSSISDTHYRVFVGRTDRLNGVGPAFEHNRTMRVVDFLDGTSNSWLVVEAQEAVPWTKPDELEIRPDLPVPPLGGISGNTFNALFADGSVRSFKQGELTDTTLRAFITRNGGEPVPPP